VRSLANEFSEKLYNLSIAIPGIGRSADAVGGRRIVDGDGRRLDAESVGPLDDLVALRLGLVRRPKVPRWTKARCDRSGRNRLLVAIEAVHLAVPRRQADGVADLMPVVAEDPRRQHPDLRNLDVEYGVGA
jgi:hypothetical protein